MGQTISVSEYRALLKTEKPQQAPKPKQGTKLEQRFNALLLPLGWRVGRARRACDDPRSPSSTGGTTARFNCLVMWQTENARCSERVRFVGWLWDVKGWSDEQVRALVVSEVSK
jgi:hypothetical protein